MTDSSGTGLAGARYWVLTGIGGVAVLLVILNIFNALGNSKVRQEVNERQQFIDQSVQLSRLHNQLVQGLATLSARSGDDELRAVLSQHGISFSIEDQDAAALSGNAASAAATEVGNQGATDQ